MYDDLAASSPAYVPCARLLEKSKTGLFCAALTILAALVASKDAVEIMVSSIVSTICASINGAVTSSNGSLLNTIVPSGTARTSPEKEMLAK